MRRVHFAVDPTLAVIEEARALGADLLVTHHPLLLRGVHSVATTSAKGAARHHLVVGDVALYVRAHQRRRRQPGVCDALAAACGLSDTEPARLERGRAAGPGGRARRAAEPRAPSPSALAARLPPAAAGIRVAGPPEAVVQRVAVLGGAGDDRFDGGAGQRRRRLRHRGPAPPPGARGARGGPRRPAVPRSTPGTGPASGSGWPGPRARLRDGLGERATRVETHISHIAHRPVDFVVGANPRRYACERRTRPPVRLLDLQAHRHPARPDRPRARHLPQLSGARRARGKARAGRRPSWRWRAPAYDDVQREVAKAECRRAAGARPRRPRPGPPRRRAPAPPRTCRPSSTSSTSLARRQSRARGHRARGHGARRGARERRRRARAGQRAR